MAKDWALEIKVFIPSLSTPRLPRTPEAIAQQASQQYNWAYAQTDGRHHQAVMLTGDRIGLVDYQGASGTKYTPLHEGRGEIPASVREKVRKTGLVISENAEAFREFKKNYGLEAEEGSKFQLYAPVPNPASERVAA